MNFFEISKLGWFVIEPSHLLIWMLIAAAILSAMQKRAGYILTSVAATFGAIVLFLPVGDWLLRPIEDAYPRPTWPPHVDGILELGNGLDGDILQARRVPGMGKDAGGLIATCVLARRYPQARIVFSGGSSEFGGGGVPEAQVAEHVFREMGLDKKRIVYEPKSRNTWENIAFSQVLVKPKPHEIWILETSAYHMPRAMAVARHLGWKMIPWPTNYLTAGAGPQTHLSFSDNLSYLDLAAHEWIGLIAYRLDNKAS